MSHLLSICRSFLDQETASTAAATTRTKATKGLGVRLYEELLAKPKLQFSDPTVGRSKRTIEIRTVQKTRRTEIMMKNRGITDKASLLINNNGEEKLLEKELVDSRKQQLQRYKQNKEILKSMSEKKPIFKAGAVTVDTKTQPTLAKENLKLSSDLKKAKNAKPQTNPKKEVIAKAVGKTPVVSSYCVGKPPIQTNLSERRVTRAMTAVTNGTGVQKGKATGSTIDSKLKGLAISGDKTKTKPVTNLKTGIIPSQKIPAKPKTDKVTPPVNMMDTSKAPSSTLAAAIPKPQKKSKPKAIDSIYSEYNLKFAEACAKLTNHCKYWKSILETNSTITEEVKDDIISAVGKANLLLDSKLPQFTTLLWAYVSDNPELVESGKILACDLEGWWDVAVIQVNAVCDSFQELKELELKNWIKTTEQPQTIKKQRKPLSTTTKITAKPSSGLQKFLAMKRKGQKSDEVEESIAQLDQEEQKKPERVIIPSLSLTPTRASGSKVPLTPVGLNASLNRTPRRLSTNLGLRMLSMRQSMGRIYSPVVTNSLCKDD